MDALLATTLRALMDRKLWNAYRSVLDDTTFTNSNASAIYAILTELHKNTKRNISGKALLTAIDATVTGDRVAELQITVKDIMEVSPDELEDADFPIRRFAARALGTKAARMVVAHGDDPAFDYSLPSSLMGRAANISAGQHQERTEACDAGLPGDVDMVREVIPLGIHPGLDRELAGGHGRGELLTVLAPPERGKTSYLWRIATNALLAGENVVAYTLEIAKYKCFMRYYQGLTGMTTSEMLKGRRKVAAARKRASKKGNLWVNDFASQPLTPSMLEADIEQMLDEGLSPSYVMIDYIELMRPSSGFGRQGKNSANLGEMVQEIRQIGMQFNIPILSAWQVNRVGADKIVFQSTDVSESWEVIKVSDIILGLNQSEHEASNGVMRVKVMKQREDPSRGLYTLKSDMRRLLINPYEGAEVNDTKRTEVSTQ